jgi:hypothetical protein
VASEEQQSGPKYRKDDYTLKGWETKIDEEEARWRHLGINLDQMKYQGSEIFAMQAKLQALINMLIEDDVSEENMNLNLKMIIFQTMEEVRTTIEPQIRQAKLVAGVPRPNVVLPWMKDGNGGS